jgi:hypothetical protein
MKFILTQKPHPFAPLLGKERGWGEVNIVIKPSRTIKVKP